MVKGIGVRQAKKNNDSLYDFYRAMGERVGFVMTIYVRDNISNELLVFENTEIELNLGSNKCSLFIRCNENESKYNSLGMSNYYTVEDGIFKFQDYSDYQRSSKQLEIYPNEFDGSRYLILKVNQIKEVE